MSNNSSGIGILSIIFTIMAYFVYERSISAMLGMLLLVIGSGITSILSLIPIFGIFISYYINIAYTYPTVMQFTGLTPTWLTTLLLGCHTIIGVILTLITSIALIHLIKK